RRPVLDTHDRDDGARTAPLTRVGVRCRTLRTVRLKRRKPLFRGGTGVGAARAQASRVSCGGWAERARLARNRVSIAMRPKRTHRDALVRITTAAATVDIGHAC